MHIKSPFPKRLPSKLLCLMLTVFCLLPIPSQALETTVPVETETTFGGEGLINILLIGQDRREDDCAARADCIILCSFQPESGNIAFTSFLRDLYLEIPGQEGNRLNAAYALGGMALLKETLQHNFGICIDGCLEVDFSRFSQIIDALGGVCVELRQDEAELINKTVPGELTSGPCQLNGSQALAYSRIRCLDTDGDFSRTNRQRKLLTSLLDSYRSVGLLKILSAVADLLPMISTDLTKKQILLLAARLFPLMDNPTVSSQRIPADGTYACEKIRGMEVLTADTDILKEQLHLLLSSISENVS